MTTALRGGRPVPLSGKRLPHSLAGCKGIEMCEYCQHINMRLTPDEKSRAVNLVKSKNLSVSKLMRILIQLPAECADIDSIHTAVIIDRDSVPKFDREMRCWDYHYNQSVHALNRIAYYD